MDASCTCLPSTSGALMHHGSAKRTLAGSERRTTDARRMDAALNGVDWTAERWTVNRLWAQRAVRPRSGSCSEACGPYQEPGRSAGTQNPLGLLKWKCIGAQICLAPPPPPRQISRRSPEFTKYPEVSGGGNALDLFLQDICPYCKLQRFVSQMVF